MSAKRSLSLSDDLDSSLLELCRYLGVSPNSYINNVLAKSVASDRNSYVVQTETKEAFSKLADFMSAIETLENKENIHN